jgi:large subunit ribosomal protein L18
MNVINRDRKNRRKRRVSANLHGTAERPRISVYRSSKHIYAQAVDDVKNVTLAAFADHKLTKAQVKDSHKTAKALEVGKQLAEQLKAKKITTAIFDRNRFAYNGRVKAIAEGLREGGIII